MCCCCLEQSQPAFTSTSSRPSSRHPVASGARPASPLPLAPARSLFASAQARIARAHHPIVRGPGWLRAAAAAAAAARIAAPSRTPTPSMTTSAWAGPVAKAHRSPPRRCWTLSPGPRRWASRLRLQCLSRRLLHRRLHQPLPSPARPAAIMLRVILRLISTLVFPKKNG